MYRTITPFDGNVTDGYITGTCIWDLKDISKSNVSNTVQIFFDTYKEFEILVNIFDTNNGDDCDIKCHWSGKDSDNIVIKITLENEHPHTIIIEDLKSSDWVKCDIPIFFSMYLSQIPRLTKAVLW